MCYHQNFYFKVFSINCFETNLTPLNTASSLQTTMTLVHNMTLLLTLFLHETVLILARSGEDPFKQYRGNSDSCGVVYPEPCYGSLPDCCSGKSDEGYYIEWCCDKNVWRYFLYAALSLCAAFFWLGLWIWFKYPECFERTFGRCWGWIVSCFTCTWIRRNFVNDGGAYQTI